MEKFEPADFDSLDEDDSKGLIDRGLFPTESIDLKGLVDELDQVPDGVPEPRRIKDTALGTLLEALPIPTLLIDRSRKIIFANLACEKFSPEYATIQGGPVSSLFPRPEAAAEAQSLVEKVFATRKTQIIEGVLKIVDKKIWGRAHLRSLKMGANASLLVLVEDLTLEKTQLHLQQKLRKELEVRVEKRTADLAEINQQLQNEIAVRKRAEAELVKNRHQLEELVIGRTSELNQMVGKLRQEAKERKKIEESLRASERRLNVAFRANPAAVSIASLKEGRYLEVNDSFCQFTGHRRDEVVGRTDTELRYWVNARQRNKMIRLLREKGEVHDYEALFRCSDGSMRVVSISAEDIELEGRPHILSIMMDVTERKRAEADHIRLITAMEQIAESILITDPKGVLKYANSAFENVSGYSRAEAVGMHISQLRSPDNDKDVLAQAKVNLDKGKAWTGRLVSKKKTGQLYEVETTISPVKGQSGRLINFVVVERDVTNEVRMEERLRQAEKMEAVGKLAGGIAHDFNNILGAMMGYLHLAMDQLAEDAPVKQDLENVLKAGNRAKELIHQILTFGRQTEQQHHPLEVAPLVKEALKLLRASIPSTIDIRRNIDPTVGRIMGDPTQIHQVIINLCTNAFHAMSGGHGILDVSLTKDYLAEGAVELSSPEMQPGEYVRLSVSDTGHGMSPSVIERIFEPYFTTKETGHGTGMGLAVVHGIVTEHGGSIAVTSQPDQGSTFDVYFPVCASKTETGEMERTTVLDGSERILLIDDEQPLVEIGERVLSGSGYKVTVMTDASRALAAFSACPGDFDLVITDLTMPKMTGLELARKMSRIRPGIPIILCTGFSEDLSKEKVTEIGISHILMKPVTPRDLKAAVRKVFG